VRGRLHVEMVNSVLNMNMNLKAHSLKIFIGRMWNKYLTGNIV